MAWAGKRVWILSTICWPTCAHPSCLETLSPSPPATVSLPATIVTSSVPTSVPGHMMYPSPHTVMYASTPALADGGLAVLNAFSQGTQAMQVSHTHSQDTGGSRTASLQTAGTGLEARIHRFVIFLCFPAQVPSLRCSSQHLPARCRSLSQQCSYTQYGKICISQVKLSYSLCNQHATLTSLMHLNRALGTQATGLHPVWSLLSECGVFSWHLVGFYLLPNTYRIHQIHRCILVKKRIASKSAFILVNS